MQVSASPPTLVHTHRAMGRGTHAQMWLDIRIQFLASTLIRVRALPSPMLINAHSPVTCPHPCTHLRSHYPHTPAPDGRRPSTCLITVSIYARALPHSHLPMPAGAHQPVRHQHSRGQVPSEPAAARRAGA
eukprot:351973-Chlamydomonas_euryale.AAC.7